MESAQEQPVDPGKTNRSFLGARIWLAVHLGLVEAIVVDLK
jgi:hypothetical protein